MNTKWSAHIRLSLVMLLQYTVWGLCLPVLARYLQDKPGEGGLWLQPPGMRAS